ncbi:cocaine esterase [Aplysia californica]|uniref:Carboxylic ester hydrolase n=1 Tax=Aplysia californica TaxID=6500 RepID=A0ABM0JI04_APLCA|nr:cocaine esterase [Aplysia californica]
MAAAWLLHALYTSMLGSSGLQGGQGGQGGGQVGRNDVYLMANTSYGTVRGKVDFTTQVPVAKFLGIPYAKSPTGKLRFKAPEAPDAWSGVKDAFQFGHTCMQMRYPLYTPSDMSEDCLFLNVYTPTTKTSPGAIPVMVWIHGGGYVTGSSSLYDGTLLAAKEVIVVTINYRLDVFGFLSTGDDVIPGNYGMMDQIAALQWVRKNIGAFGGDPNQVTIFGESAGSSSVSLLTISPLSKGLFQRAIMESGASLSPFGFQHPGNRISALTNARLIATGVMCGNLDDPKKLLSCLQNVDVQRLLNVSVAVSKALDVNLIMCPRVEKTFGFLPDLPGTLLSRGEFNHVDTIRGFNTDETGAFIRNLIKRPISPEVADDILHYWLKQMSSLAQEQAATILKSRYMKDELNVVNLQRDAMEAQDDFAFIGPTIIEANEFSRRAPEKSHYLYEFNYRPSYSMYPKWMSATHSDEIGYVFGVQQLVWIYGILPTKDDFSVSKQIMDLWTNFAKTGNPTPTVHAGSVQWNQYSATMPNYLLIKLNSQQKTWQRPEAADVFSQVLQKLDGTRQTPVDTIIG